MMDQEGAHPVVLAEAAAFTLDPLRVEPSLRTVHTAAGPITLEPRVMQVLVVLANRAGEVVSRDELIARCWNGTVVGDDAIQRCIARLRRLADAHGGFRIETIPRIGYRMLPERNPSMSSSEPDMAEDTTGHPPAILFAAVQSTATEERAAFGEVLADDVTAALSLNRDLEVAPRPSSDQLNADPVQLAEASGVDYVIVARLDEVETDIRFRIQITALRDQRIIETDIHTLANENGAVPSDDLVIDLASRIHAAVMRDATHRALRKRENLSAWEAVIRSMSAYQRISTDGMAFAISEARRAVALDPEFGSAHAALALSLAGAYEVGGAERADWAEESRRYADRALALDPDNPTVLTCVASARGMTSRPPEGLELAERAVRLSPTHPIAHLYLARHYLYHGRAEDALMALDEHDRVAPRFPWQYYIAFQRGLAEYLAGHLEAAGKWYERASTLNPDYPFSWIARAVYYSLAGDPDAARRAAQRLRQLEGDASQDLQIRRIRHAYPDPSTVDPLIDLFKIAWGGEPEG